MSASRCALLPALGLTAALLAGCAGAPERAEGAPVTAEEALLLAGLLAENHDRGGADFVVSAPFGADAVLTLSGEVDLAGGAGRARAVTSYGAGRAEEVRTLFFTAEQVWFGEVPGLPAALRAEGLPAAAYLRRPVVLQGTAPLLDVLTSVVLGLAAAEPDDAGDFRNAGYTWGGDRSIDGELARRYVSAAGWSVAVDRSTDLLVQYHTPLPGEQVEVSVTLSDHGPRQIALPAEEESVDGAQHPGVAAALGL